MAKAKRSTPRTSPDPAALLDSALKILGSDGALKLSALGPTPVRAALAEQLAKQGFELSGSWVRKPLAAQLVDALADGAFISMKAVPSHAAGATAAEAKRAALAVVASGGAKLVLRGTEEVLVPTTSAVLSREDLKRFGDVAKVVAKAASSKSGASLLRSDLLEALERVTPGISGVGAPRGRRATESMHAHNQREPHFSELLAAVEQTRDPRTGLSFVPAVVAMLRPELGAESTSAVLLAAATAGLLELRPEGGINRLSEEELSACPEGPQGTRLSWARRTEVMAP